MRTPYFIIFIVVVLLISLFIGILAYYSYNPPAPTPPNLPSGRGGNESISPPLGGGVGGGAQQPNRPVIASTDPVRGNPNAPLAIVEFSDFFCPACAETETALKQILLENEGKVKLIWKDLPNTRRHPLTDKAAQAARCAQEQGKFWEYHDRLFENQENLNENYFVSLASELDLDISQFSECLSSERAADLVNRSRNEAIFLQVDSTPYFFVGDRRFAGVLDKEKIMDLL